ncbi:MAG: Fe-S cluster assembly protein SufD [Micropepsaceae bacterium]
MPRQVQSQRSDFDLGIDKAFAEALRNLPGGSWLQKIRSDALERYARTGLPGRRAEWWKYTDLASILQGGKASAHPSPASRRERAAFASPDLQEISIVEGHVEELPATALQDGVEILALRDALGVPSPWLRPLLQPSDQSVDNLNLALATDGVLIRIGQSIRARKTVCIRTHLSASQAMAHWRSYVSLEEGAELDLIEIDIVGSEQQSLATARTHFSLAPGAKLRHLRITSGQGNGILLRSDTMDLGGDAEYHGQAFCAGPALVRQDREFRLNGERAKAYIACAYAVTTGQLADFSLEVKHVAPQTTSRILAKGIASGSGRGVIQGRVRVDKDAQQSDSLQMARGLMLSSTAEIDHRPELEIYADDVKCGHGATIGALDQDQIFYLESRGIPESEARMMLVRAYFGEIVKRAPDSLVEELENWVATHMTRAGDTP